MASTFTVKNLKGYIAAGANVIVAGEHGVGKTARLNEACAQLGLKVDYYSASTLDPFTDIVGIPVPNTDSKVIEYYRPEKLAKAEVLFFDEINRADPKTINAIFEITQFGTINGEKLPNLKCVIAAMNPVTEEYETEELDPAFLDRFDIFLQADAEIDGQYFITKYGENLGTAAVEFWEEYHRGVTASRRSASKANLVPYLSPRRMDKVVELFRKIPTRATVRDSMPPEVTDSSVVVSLFNILNEAVKKAATPAGVSSEVTAITNLPISKQGSKDTGERVTKLLESGRLLDTEKAQLLTSLSLALNTGKGPDTLMVNFGPAILAMSPTQKTSLTRGWAETKVRHLDRLISDATVTA